MPPLKEEPQYQTFDHLMQDFYAQQELESATKVTLLPRCRKRAIINRMRACSYKTAAVCLFFEGACACLPMTAFSLGSMCDVPSWYTCSTKSETAADVVPSLSVCVSFLLFREMDGCLRRNVECVLNENRSLAVCVSLRVTVHKCILHPTTMAVTAANENQDVIRQPASNSVSQTFCSNSIAKVDVGNALPYYAHIPSYLS